MNNTGLKNMVSVLSS